MNALPQVQICPHTCQAQQEGPTCFIAVANTLADGLSALSDLHEDKQTERVHASCGKTICKGALRRNRACTGERLKHHAT